MSNFFKVAGIILAVLIIIGLGGYIWLTNVAERNLSSLVYENVDMNTVPDGIYYGEADAWPVFVRVEVRVKNHRIDDIKIVEHKNGMGSKAESIIGMIIERNSYEVDAISGATLSSEAIKSAVSKALIRGCQT